MKRVLAVVLLGFGLAAGAAPRYAGSQDYRVVGAPVLRADFGNGAFIDMLQGAGYTYKFGNGMFATASLGYALGRSVTLSDEPLLDAVVATLENNDYRFSTAIEEIVTSPQFRNHRGIDVTGN